MEKKHIINSPRVMEMKNARQKKRKRAFFAALICLLLLLASLILLARYSKFRIASVEISGNKVVETSDILANVSSSLAGYHFFIFPKNNIALIPEKEIVQNLEQNFNRLTNIKIKLKAGNVLALSMTERTGSYTWCGEGFTEGQTLAQTECYFADDAGYVFDKAPYFAGDIYFRLFGNLDNTNKKNGYFAQKDFENYITFKKALENMTLKPIALYHKSDGETEFYLKHENEPPSAPKIIFNQSDNILKVIENLQSAMNAEPLKTDIKTKYDKLLYIDLRFGNKVYFKFSAEGGSDPVGS